MSVGVAECTNHSLLRLITLDCSVENPSRQSERPTSISLLVDRTSKRTRDQTRPRDERLQSGTLSEGLSTITFHWKDTDLPGLYPRGELPVEGQTIGHHSWEYRLSTRNPGTKQVARGDFRNTIPKYRPGKDNQTASRISVEVSQDSWALKVFG